MKELLSVLTEDLNQPEIKHLAVELSNVLAGHGLSTGLRALAIVNMSIHKKGGKHPDKEELEEILASVLAPSVTQATAMMSLVYVMLIIAKWSESSDKTDLLKDLGFYE